MFVYLFVCLFTCLFVVCLFICLFVLFVCFFVREFARSIPRPFSVRYNPYTESVEVIDDKPSVQRLVGDIKYSVGILQDAMEKIK